MEKTMATFSIDEVQKIFRDANREAMKECCCDHTMLESRKVFEAAGISGAFWDRVWRMNAAARNDHDDAAVPILVYRAPYMVDGVKTESDIAEYRCPSCGCRVGELYIPDYNAQCEDHYCADCGLRLDWQSVEEDLPKTKEGVR